MPIDGSDFSDGDLFSHRHINKLKNSWSSATAPTSPATGNVWWDSTNNRPKVYTGAAWEMLLFTLEISEGTVCAWIGGYFGDGANGSYTRVLGTDNTVAAVNTLLNSSGWYVCDGAALNDAASTIYDGANRYLPELTDDRFLQGDTVAGGTGGSSTQAHTHDVDIASVTLSTPSAVQEGQDTGSGAAATDDHQHTVDFPNTTSGAASVTENRPKYLGCFYIQKVK